ncbi:MAG TPA: proton-conducting transporter membrane subunit, partial [Dehalococcoidia bacterium]|nr:proton-conducting transporter membrane subunit [Dehalococcoidia bacterium]
VSHGLITGLLFALVGLVYEKAHERSLDRLGGLARQMPFLTVAFTLAGLAALGLPGTSGFAAEFFVFLGSFTSGAFSLLRPLTILAAVGIVLTAGYILLLLRRVFYDPPLEKYAHAVDASPLEMACVAIFVVMIMLLGLYPAIITDIIQVGVGPLALLR